MDNKVKICLIPAAGIGSRWSPLSSFIPKELLPLDSKPAIEWVVEEALRSGCTHIIIVISQQKELIRTYLDKRKFTKAKLSFIYQEKPRGVLDAIWLAKDLIKNNHFCVALPDLPTFSKRPVLKQLIEVFENFKADKNLTSLGYIPPKQRLNFGECLIKQKKGDVYKLVHFCPSSQYPYNPHHKNQSLRLTGRHVFKNDSLKVIRDLIDSNVKEVSDRLLLQTLSEEYDSVLGVEIDGETLDIGNPWVYAEANYLVSKLSVRKSF